MKFGCCLPGASFVPQIGDASASQSGVKMREVDTMKQGVFAFRDAGCDFIEMNVVAITRLSDADYNEFKAFLKENNIVIEAFCSFVPPEIPLVGEKVNRVQIMHYIQKALLRCAGCGAKVVVFGSGAARSCPEGFPKEKAQEQLVEFLRMCSDCSGAMGLLVKIAIEPLNANETNMIVGIREGYELWKQARAVGCRQVYLLADSYHMHVCGDDVADIEEMSEALTHVHIADRDRLLPGKAKDGFDYAAFFSELKKAGYEGRISAECPMGDLFADAKYCVEYAKKVWDAV